LLRRGKIKRYVELDEWNAVLIESAGQVDGFRKSYVDTFVPVFRDTLSRLICLEDVQATYSRGWSQEEDYGQALEQSFQRDAERGVTHIGPHRADLRLRVAGREAESSLSRGQQKLVVCAMRVAQGILLARASGKTCVFLVDDLPSELDEKHRRRLSQLLEQVGHQVFVTGVDRDALRVGWTGKDIKMFHVEHGEVTEVFESSPLADSSLILERQATDSPY
jgi:DNA replication and repair protein RecF